MKATRLIIVSVLIASVLALTGCGSTGGTGGKLEGIRWILKSYESKGATTKAPAGVTIDALFEGGKVGGSSGVNTYSGSYELSGSSLSVGKLASTMMAGPQDLMEAEQAYLAALQKTSSYSSTGESLTLLDQGGKEILQYTKGKAISLTIGTWDALSYFNGGDAITSTIAGTRLTAVFASGGSLTGSTGINEYKANYESQGLNITISDTALTTSNTSADPALTRQEQDYLSALKLAAKYKISGERLDLLRAEGTIAATFTLAK
jgi:heat shock protein HslJ